MQNCSLLPLQPRGEVWRNPRILRRKKPTGKPSFLLLSQDRAPFQGSISASLQGSKDSGKEARLSWWQVPGKAVGKMETMPCPTGCEALRPGAHLARRKGITLPPLLVSSKRRELSVWPSATLPSVQGPLLPTLPSSRGITHMTPSATLRCHLCVLGRPGCPARACVGSGTKSDQLALAKSSEGTRQN